MAYITTSGVQAELSSTVSFSTATVPTEAQVTTWIDEVEDYIDLINGESVETASYTELINYKGEELIQLKHAPVNLVSALSYSTSKLGADTYPAWVLKTEDTDYSVYSGPGEVEILFSNFKPKEGNKRISITYNAGYSTVPDRYVMLGTKMVAKRVIDSVMQKDVREKQSGKSISVGSINIVKPADFGVKQYSSLTSEIDQIKSEIANGTGVYRYNNY